MAKILFLCLVLALSVFVSAMTPCLSVPPTLQNVSAELDSVTDAFMLLDVDFKNFGLINRLGATSERIKNISRRVQACSNLWKE